MEISLLALIGIGLGTMFFGYFFGLFEGRGQGYRRRTREEPARELELLATKQAAVPEAIKGPEERAAASDLWLELGAGSVGQPRMNLDGQPVDTSKLTPAQHKRLIELMILMRPWLEARTQTAPDAVVRAPSDARAPSPAQQAGSPRGDVNVAPRPVPASIAGSGALPGVPVPAEVGAPTSMVVQIDTILQARLQGTPLASLGIRLAESLNGGAIVFVGKQSYGGVADVPDPQVQAAIREAIAEWEKKYTPG
jgi:hypothetical protein